MNRLLAAARRRAALLLLPLSLAPFVAVAPLVVESHAWLQRTQLGPLPAPAVYDLIRARGGATEAELWSVFNMGCGFIAVVPEHAADAAVALLAEHHPGSARIGTVTATPGAVEVPPLGVAL